MPRKKEPAKKVHDMPHEQSTYRGHTIEVCRCDPEVKGARGVAMELLIDGQAISVEQTDDGYLSHDSMFRIYSSPFELAEDLIKQFGDAPVRPAAHPGGVGHDHGGHRRDHPTGHSGHVHDHDEEG